jgi:hypothetical protein
MGAGMGAGIAIGMTSGQKKAVSQIRDYLVTHELTVHDRAGKEVLLDEVLDDAVGSQCCATGGWRAAVGIAVLLVGLLVFAALAWHIWL